MFVKLAVLLAVCAPVGSDGDAAPVPAPVAEKVKTAEEVRRECDEVDRRLEASLKRTDELLRSLGMTLPKGEPVPPLNLVPNVPMSSSTPIASDGDAAPAPAPVASKVKLKTLEEIRRESEELDRRVEASLKRSDELLRSLGMTLPKGEPVPPLNLVPNVPMSSSTPIASDGDGGADTAPAPVAPKVKTVEETLRQCRETDRRVEATLKRTDELLRSLGLTLPKVEPVPRPDLLPNVPKSSSATVASDGDAVAPVRVPPPLPVYPKPKAFEQSIRDSEELDRDVAATIKRADELFRLLGVTTPKLVPEPRPDLLPNVPMSSSAPVAPDGHAAPAPVPVAPKVKLKTWEEVQRECDEVNRQADAAMNRAEALIRSLGLTLPKGEPVPPLNLVPNVPKP
ncbi:hypothetical protein R5W23_002300 [Gemmata sp. JC673]|uniref:Secreted protein n=1 Tax=Gemmata algarum TaxID=2975278 RepID=A0ABU5F578_9BACT|nr:hypothetical protein [Gemmata algarum]MDY3561041.1 hypothetical protein [Gemmata algarum]